MSFKDFRKTIKEENGTIEAPVSAPSVSPVAVVPEIPHEVPATVQEPAPEMAKSMAGATGRLINMKGNQGIYKMIITDIEGNKTVGKVYFSIMGREAEVEISFIISLNGENLKVSYPEGKRIEAEIESVLGESTTNSFKNYLRELEEEDSLGMEKRWWEKMLKRNNITNISDTDIGYLAVYTLTLDEYKNDYIKVDKTWEKLEAYLKKIIPQPDIVQMILDKEIINHLNAAANDRSEERREREYMTRPRFEEPMENEPDED